MVRRMVVTGVAAAVLVAGLLAWQVRQGPAEPSQIRELPLVAER